MNARTKFKLLLATRSIGLAIPSFLAVDAMASVVGPYSVDGNTVVLYHFDEAAGSTFSVNQQPFPGQNNAIGFVQTSASAAGTVDATILGKTGASGFGFGNFGNAAATSGNQVLGYDGNGNTTYEPDLNTNTTNTNVSADAITSSLFTDPSTGAFSVDAMVNIPTAFANSTNHEIVSWDSSNGTAGQRGFQFRFSVSATGVVSLQYDNISDGIAAVTVPLPTQGADAFTLNKWFHVAMAYDGTQGPASVKLYWTGVDDANTKAHLIGTGGQNDLTGSANPNVLTFGNENRNTAGEALAGSLDELRISNNVRAATDYLFGGATAINAWNISTGGDWDQSGAWTIATPNSAGAVADFGDGNNSPSADSVITLTGAKTVGELDFNSAAFKYTLTPISPGGGTLVLNNNGGVTTVNNLSGNHTIALPVTLGGAGNNFSVNVGTLTVSSPMSNPSGGTGAVTKLGPGVMIVTATNTYTGATSVGQGVLRAPDGNGLPTSSNLVLNGGVYQTGVNFARAGGTGGTQMQITGGASGFGAFGADIQVAYGTVASPAALTWGSSTFNPSSFILNDPTATNNISFLDAINLNGASRTIEVDANTATLSGALTNSTGTASLTKVGNGVLALTGINTYNGTTTITTGTLRADSGVGLSPNTNLSVAGGVFETGANLTRALGTGAGSIQIPTASAGQFNANNATITIAITNGGSPITWGGPTFLPSTIVFNTGTTGNINFAADLDLAGATRTVQVNNNSATFSGVISDSLLTGSLTKTGGGLLALTGASTYTGTTLVSAGHLRVPNGLPNSNITVNGGFFTPTGTQAITLGTAAGSVQFTGGNSGFSAVNADGTVTINNGGVPVPVGVAPFAPAVLTFSATTGNTVTLTNDLDLGTATRALSVTNGTAVITGAITGGTGGNLQLNDGTGILVLAGSGSFTGSTTIGSAQLPATIRAAANNALGSGQIFFAGQGNGTTSRLELSNNITLSNATISLTGRTNPSDAFRNVGGNNTVQGLVTMQVGGGNFYEFESDAGTLTFTGATSATPGVALTCAAGGARFVEFQGSAAGVMAGGISNGTAVSFNPIKRGTGIWYFNGANTYVGTTALTGGTLSTGSIANGGATSGIGASDSSASNIAFGGGAMQYTGPGASTDRLFSITAAGGTLDASGSAPLVLANTGAIATTDPTPHNSTGAAGSNILTILDTAGGNVQQSAMYDLVPGITIDGNAAIPAGTTITAVGFGTVTLSNALTAAIGAAGTATNVTFGTSNRTFALAGSNAGANTIAGVLSDSSGGGKLGVSKIGTGYWLLTGNNNYTGLTSVGAGTLELSVASQSPISTGGADITGGHLLLDYTGSSIATAVRGQLGAGTIHSSNGTSAIGLGMRDSGSAIAVSRAYFGDANLDGTVNALDFNAVAINFGSSGKFWTDGDFNYDGTVNSVDFTKLAQNFNSVLPPSSLPVLGSLVPEPASLGLLVSGGLLLRRRRGCERRV